MNGSDDQQTAAARAFTEGGPLGRFMAGIDWAATPLGPTGRWPPRLIETLRIMLSAEQPMALSWGPAFTMLYNEAYASVIGSKHPWALGSPAHEVFRESWDDPTGPLFRSVVDGRKALLASDQPFMLERHGFVEQTYFDISYQPVLLDDGTVGGLLCIVTETTGRVLGERRLRLLTEISSRTAGLRAPQQIARAVTDMLARYHEDIPFAHVYLASEPGLLRLAASVGSPDTGSTAQDTAQSTAQDTASRAPESIRLDTLDAAHGTGAAARLAHVVADVAPAELPAAPFADASSPAAATGVSPAAEQALALPLACMGQVGGVLVAGLNSSFPPTDAYRDFLGVLASGVAAALSAALSHEEQRKRAEELAELDRAKTTFFSNVSHEFRTPLTLLLGPVQEALADEERPGRRAQLELAERNALRLLKLVNTLLDVSRAEAGRLYGAFEPVDLSRATAELAEVFRSAFDMAGLELDVDCPPLPEPVHVDREMWEKIVLNLLSNTLKFTFSGGARVRMAAVGNRTRLTVADTGTGVPEEELPHLFERFHQVRGARSRSHEGSGIGLALVKDLVELHGGSISVSSRLKEGTEFTVEIPFGTEHLPSWQPPAHGGGRRLEQAEAYSDEALGWLADDGGHNRKKEALAGGAPHSPADERFSPGIGPPGTDKARRPRLLVAEDNADMRFYLSQLLEPEHDVLLAPDGLAALDAVLAETVDLVLTDAMMPGLDGFELVRVLRADPRTARLPIVMLTARAGEEAAIQGRHAGADDYLAKPFSARQLLARIRANLELARMRERVLEETRNHLAKLVSLTEAGLRLSATLDPRQVLETAGNLLVPDLADQVSVRLTDVWSAKGAGTPPHTAKAGASTPTAYTTGKHVVEEEVLTRAATETMRGLGSQPVTGGRHVDNAGGEGTARTLLSLPLVSRNQVLGALAVARSEGGYSQAERKYLEDLASRLALAYDNATRYQNERRLALTLQRALLPQHLPQAPGLRTASYYRASSIGTEIGGDWYDVVALPGGSVGLAIGDVMGHDVDAATVMGQLRSALHGYALDRLCPSEVLAKLDAYLRSLDVEHFATCLYAVYEPQSRRLHYASSGHLPPLVVAGERTGYLETSPELPLGLGNSNPVSHEVRLAPGTGLLLYTDGLVENRALSLGVGLAALRQTCGTLPASALFDPQGIIDRALGLLETPGRVDDDTALLAAVTGTFPPRATGTPPLWEAPDTERNMRRVRL